MKLHTRCLILLLVLSQILLCFAACGDPDSSSGEMSESESESIATAPVFELTKELLSSYCIVYPSQSDEDMEAVARLLQRTIRDYSGVELEIKDDFLIEGSDLFSESEYEILIGSTNRAESIEFNKTVKQDDSGYAMDGKKLLIIGFTNAAANESVIQFKLDVLMKEPENGVILKDGDAVIRSKDYEHRNLLINGVDIVKYKIVYPAACVKGENEIASYLQDYITRKTGYVIPCESDAGAVSEYEIQLGETTRVTDEMIAERDGAGYSSDRAYIGEYEGGLWLSGNGRDGLYAALTKLLAKGTVEGEDISLEIPSSLCEEIKGLQLSVLNYNVYYDLNEEKRNPDHVILSVKQKAPDVFGLNESGMNWINKFCADSEIAADYALVQGMAADREADSSYNPIFYRKEKFDLVESGTKWLTSKPDIMSILPDGKHYRILTYVILRDKTSGVEFMYINTHLDGSNDSSSHNKLDQVRLEQSEAIKKFAAGYSYLPIVLGGDFNADPTSDVIRGMSKNTRFKYCLSIAEEKIDIESTKQVSSDFEPLEKGGVLDYIFATEDSIAVRKYEQFDNPIDGKYPSDHLPVYAEITVRY